MNVHYCGSSLHFRGIGDSKSLEDAPRNATKNLRNEKRLHVLSREENRSETSDQDQAAEHSIPVPDPLRDDTIDEQADDLANVGSI